MQCPVCEEKLRAIVRFDVEVDICPGCKGVWLERGELEKILQYARQGGPGEAAPAEAQGPPPPPGVGSFPPQPQPRPEPPRHESDDHRGRRDHDDDDDDKRYSERREGSQGRRRRGSWLGDILDGFGGD